MLLGASLYMTIGTLCTVVQNTPSRGSMALCTPTHTLISYNRLARQLI